MGRPRDVAMLLQEGLSPSGIASRLGISIGSVRQYLWVAAGEGLILRSDVLFSFPKELRRVVEEIVRTIVPATITQLEAAVQKKGIRHDRDELDILWSLIASRSGYGDLYEFVTSTEALLHNHILTILKAQFGDYEAGWWRRGIPEPIRLACVKAREQSEDDAEPYEFTTLIHLSEIIERHWALFISRLPKEVISDKKDFLRKLKTLNGIRNRVMHPTRLHKISDEDFEFARELHRKLRSDAWR
jgi:predicted transcriptional regulator